MEKQEMENILWLIDRRIKEIKEKFDSKGDILLEAIKQWEKTKDNLILFNNCLYQLEDDGFIIRKSSLPKTTK
mgnify:CR=1 FL=1